jgi:hypothetical protein
MLRLRCSLRGAEPTLDEILAEPAVRLLMSRDGVDEGSLRRLVHDARLRTPKRRWSFLR